MEIPFQHLSAEALVGIIEEFVSREGTDYGDFTFTLQDKVEQVKSQLKKGQVRILYDDGANTCHIEKVGVS